jgi:hypothetical protein
MKLTTVILLLVTGITAYVERIDLADGTVASHWVEGEEPALQKRGCTKNNCLRALIARPAAGSAFCSTYTAAVNTADNPFTNCAKATMASTACSCFAPVGFVCHGN